MVVPGMGGGALKKLPDEPVPTGVARLLLSAAVRNDVTVGTPGSEPSRSFERATLVDGERGNRCRSSSKCVAST